MMDYTVFNIFIYDTSVRYNRFKTITELMFEEMV